MVVRENLLGGPLLFILYSYKHTNRRIVAIFHGTIFSGGPRPREKIFKWSSILIRLRTAALDYSRDYQIDLF